MRGRNIHGFVVGFVIDERPHDAVAALFDPGGVAQQAYRDLIVWFGAISPGLRRAAGMPNDATPGIVRDINEGGKHPGMCAMATSWGMAGRVFCSTD